MGVPTHTLPQPDKPAGLWARFITQLYEHGKRHAIQSIVREELEAVMDSMVESYDRGEQKPVVRPSGNLACARQAWLLEKYGTENEDDGNRQCLFSAGHFFHALAFAYCRTALPPGFSLETEQEPESMPDWWPDRPSFNQTGHQDMILRVTDPDLAALYLLPSAGSECLVDFKSMGGWGYSKHKSTPAWEGPDSFGYMAQMAVYSDGSAKYDEHVLAAISKNQLMAPLVCRVIPSNVTSGEMYRLRKGFEKLEAGTDPGPEFFMRWGKQAAFTCGVPGQKLGACSQSGNCHEEGWPV